VTAATIPRGAVTITRRQAHDAHACVEDTRRVLDHIRARDGRIPRKDQRISLQDVADVLGVDGVVWCLWAVGGHDDSLRRFACVCARRALRRAGACDARSWRAVRVAQWHAHGWATEEEMAAARDAAWDAERDAAPACAAAQAAAASQAAACAAAQAAACAAAQAAAAQAAAWHAMWAAGWYASQDAARDAARDAEREAQWRLLLSMAGYGGEA
jgi:hypothetical protein